MQNTARDAPIVDASTSSAICMASHYSGILSLGSGAPNVRGSSSGPSGNATCPMLANTFQNNTTGSIRRGGTNPMKTTASKLLGILCIIFFLIASFAGYSYYVSTESRRQIEQQFAAVQDDLAIMQEDLSETQEDLGETQTDLAISQDSFAAIQAKLVTAQDDLQSAQTSLVALHNRLSIATDQLQTLQALRVTPASSFQATASQRQVNLDWQYPAASGSILIRYSTEAFPLTPVDGILLYRGTKTSYVHTSLSDNQAYKYSLWVTRLQDSTPYYSSPLTATATTPQWTGLNGEHLYETIDGYVGSGDVTLHIHNNVNAENPSWAELSTFLSSDDTNTIPYVDDVFMCGEFAVTLHDRAESNGIRAAVVCLTLINTYTPTPFGNLYDLWPKYHACNAFTTSDRGLVFIDDTGNWYGTGEDRSITSMTIGSPLEWDILFSDAESYSSYGDLHKYETFW